VLAVGIAASGIHLNIMIATSGILAFHN